MISGIPFPTRHFRPYAEGQSACDWSAAGGEAGARHVLEVRCAMVARSSSDRPDRPLSEVTFLTVAEVASVMRVSKMTVYRLVHAGTLPAVRVGRSFRVPEQAVHEYLDHAYVDTA
ncbi:MAG: hypothetical protein QOJ90_2408 [Actinomycetota bacterium]|nr:hypothetical protein [Actinomycetota bacterium]